MCSSYTFHIKPMKKYVAEFFGTFVLTLVVALSLAGTFGVPTPVLAGLTLALFVYTIGPISGAHINPGVTIGLWLIGKIKGNEAINYLLAQFLGAGVAHIIVLLLKGWGSFVNVQNTLTGGIVVGFAEIVGMIIFTFGIAAVIFNKVPVVLSGAVIGGSLFIGITIASLLGSNGILNPAVALGIGSFNFMYLVGPIFGAYLGMNLYKRLIKKDL